MRLRMAETLREAVTFVEQGHVRVGPDTVTDPAYLVRRRGSVCVHACACARACVCVCACVRVYV